LLACASALAPRWPPCARPCEWLRTSESYLGALIETCRYCVQCLCFCRHRCCALARKFSSSWSIQVRSPWKLLQALARSRQR
jgi:hypothetical protein